MWFLRCGAVIYITMGVKLMSIKKRKCVNNNFRDTDSRYGLTSGPGGGEG